MRRSLFLLGVTSIVACGTEPTPPPPPFAGKIVFASDRAEPGGSLELWAMDPVGTGIRKIPVPLSPGYAQPAISPDGKQLVFNRAFALYTFSQDATDLNLAVTAGIGAARPAWSPDGSRIAFDALQGGVDDIWIVDLPGGQPVNLTQTPDVAESAPSWSPDGTSLVFDRGLPDGSIPFELWIIRANGTDAHRVIADTENDALNPAFSPDGNWIAYASGAGYAAELRLIRPDGTDDHLLFHPADDNAVDNPSWAQDGHALVFSYGTAIATISVDGSGFHVIVDSDFNADPDWGPAIQP
jgi:Tol biopolymer transport system component